MVDHRPSERVAIVVQARMSSTRLPGKVLRPLAGEPALVRIAERLARVSLADELLIATSEDPSDDPIEALCVDRGLRCVRGSLDDVLGRYRGAAQAAQADAVVRVTGDCPLHDPEVVGMAIRRFLERDGEVNYVSNLEPRTYPDGLDVEVFGREVLERAFHRAETPYDREHVTPWIRRNTRCASFTQRVDLSELRWTLDYADDYETISTIYEALFRPGEVFGRSSVYRLLTDRPELIRVVSREPLGDDARCALVDRIMRQLAEDDASQELA